MITFYAKVRAACLSAYSLIAGISFLLFPLQSYAESLPQGQASLVSIGACAKYGMGFFALPGTDSCIRFGGQIRADTVYTPTKNAAFVGVGTNALVFVTPSPSANGSTFVPAASQDNQGWETRAYVSVDSRTPTPWGDLRAYVRIHNSSASGFFGSSYMNLQGTGIYGVNGPSVFLPWIDAAFVQFAGFTAGRAPENFSFLPGYNYQPQLNSAFSMGVKQLTYTYIFGNGFSGTLGIEDRRDMLTPDVYPGGLGSSLTGLVPNPQNTTGAITGPEVMPNVVGNLRLDRDWGAFQLMGDLIQNTAVYNGAGLLSVSPTPLKPGGLGSDNKTLRKLGFSLGFGLKINLPFLAAGDAFWILPAYSNGDLIMVEGDNSSSNIGNIGWFERGLLRVDRNLWIVGPNAGSIKGKNEIGWSTSSIFTHYWRPDLRSNFFLSYLSVTPPAAVRSTDWTLGGISRAHMVMAGGQLIWSPTKAFDIGLEVAYEKISQKLNCSSPSSCASFETFFPHVSIAPDQVSTRLRFERTF